MRFVLEQEEEAEGQEEEDGRGKWRGGPARLRQVVVGERLAGGLSRGARLQEGCLRGGRQAARSSLVGHVLEEGLLLQHGHGLGLAKDRQLDGGGLPLDWAAQ